MHPGALKSSITQLLKLDNDNENIFGPEFPEQQQQQPTKHRKYATCILKVILKFYVTIWK